MSTDEAAAEITIYADYACPFCFLGRQSLERYREQRTEPLAIDWHPFDLRRDDRGPDGSIDRDGEDEMDDAYFERAKENVRRLQAEYDVEMAQELRTDVDSLPAQLVSYAVAREHPEAWEAVDGAIYDALWREGDDIGDDDVLEDAVASAGLPEGVVESALADDALRAEIDERFATAREQGVTGVPAFVFDGRAARGAVPPAHLERLIEG